MTTRFGRVLAAIAHAGLLVAPAIAFERIEAATRPRAIAIVILLLVLAAIESRAADRPKRGGRLLALASSLALLMTAWLAIASPGSNAIGPWFGAVVAGVGIVFRALALRALGSGFSSAVEPGPVLVQRGIYGRVRHPSELGLLLVGFGVAVLGESLLGGIGAIALALTVTARLAREESALRTTFGPAYLAYRATTPLLFPRIYS